MYDFIKVSVAALAMPLPISMAIMLLGAMFLIMRRNALGWSLSFGGLLLLGLLSWAPVADRLLAPFEQSAPMVSAEQDWDYIVVLGSGWDTRAEHRPASMRLTESALTRLVEGIRLWRQAPNATLTVTGASRLDEAPMAWGYRDAAVELGVPLTSLWVLDQPTDTGKEAREFAKKLAQEVSGDHASLRIALVTSASHLPRAMRHFQAVGLNPVAAPTHFLSYAQNPAHLSYWIPSAIHLRKTERAWYEFLASFWVRFEHGQNDKSRL